MGGNWSQQKIDEFKRLAAQGVPATELASRIGATRRGVLYKARMDGIDIVVHTPEEAAAIKARKDERSKARVRPKDTRKRVRSGKKTSQTTALPTGSSKTSAEYRRRWHGITPEMTKREMREDLRQAVLNTGGRI